MTATTAATVTSTSASKRRNNKIKVAPLPGAVAPSRYSFPSHQEILQKEELNTEGSFLLKRETRSGIPVAVVRPNLTKALAQYRLWAGQGFEVRVSPMPEEVTMPEVAVVPEPVRPTLAKQKPNTATPKRVFARPEDTKKKAKKPAAMKKTKKLAEA